VNVAMPHLRGKMIGYKRDFANFWIVFHERLLRLFVLDSGNARQGVLSWHANGSEKVAPSRNRVLELPTIEASSCATWQLQLLHSRAKPPVRASRPACTLRPLPLELSRVAWRYLRPKELMVCSRMRSPSLRSSAYPLVPRADAPSRRILTGPSSQDRRQNENDIQVAFAVSASQVRRSGQPSKKVVPVYIAHAASSLTSVFSIGVTGSRASQRKMSQKYTEAETYSGRSQLSPNCRRMYPVATGFK
jgi:hypothetical protein